MRTITPGGPNANALAGGLILLMFACLPSKAFTLQQAQNVAGLSDAQTLMTKGQLSEAETELRALLIKSPESLEAHELLGLALYRKHQPRDSMAEFVAASKLGQLTAFDLRIFGLDCAAIPDYPEAEKWLQHSIEKNAQDGATWEALGHVRFLEQHYKDALTAFDEALKLEPGSVAVEAMLGRTNEALADADAAEKAYRTANEWQKNIAVKDPAPVLGLGRVLLNANRAEEALPWLEQAVKLLPDARETHELCGLALTRTGKAKEAVVEFERAVQLEPKTARLHLLLGKALRAAGENEKADAELALYAKLKEGEQP